MTFHDFVCTPFFFRNLYFHMVLWTSLIYKKLFRGRPSEAEKKRTGTRRPPLLLIVRAQCRSRLQASSSLPRLGTVALGLEKTRVLHYHVDTINIPRMGYTSNEAVGLKYIISNNINRDFYASAYTQQPWSVRPRYSCLIELQRIAWCASYTEEKPVNESTWISPSCGHCFKMNWMKQRRWRDGRRWCRLRFRTRTFTFRYWR